MQRKKGFKKADTPSKKATDRLRHLKQEVEEKVEALREVQSNENISRAMKIEFTV